MNKPTKYWIIVSSKDHVKRAIAEGIAQSCHGKASPLKRMHQDDFILFYSGKHTMEGGQVCQEFTALAKVMDDAIYQVRVSQDFCPSRRRIAFLPSTAVSILPLLADLNFIRDKKNWGYPFRFGLLEIDLHDFDLIASLMLPTGYVPTH